MFTGRLINAKHYVAAGRAVVALDQKSPCKPTTNYTILPQMKFKLHNSLVDYTTHEYEKKKYLLAGVPIIFFCIILIFFYIKSQRAFYNSYIRNAVVPFRAHSI